MNDPISVATRVWDLRVPYFMTNYDFLTLSYKTYGDEVQCMLDQSQTPEGPEESDLLSFDLIT